MKLEDAIRIGLGLRAASSMQMQEALTTMAAELEMMRTQEHVAAVDRVHGQMCLQFGDGRTIYDMPVGMKLFARPVLAVKSTVEGRMNNASGVWYDWSKAPDWAEWGAVDHVTMFARFYSLKPLIGERKWINRIG